MVENAKQGDIIYSSELYSRVLDKYFYHLVFYKIEVGRQDGEHIISQESLEHYNKTGELKYSFASSCYKTSEEAFRRSIEEDLKNDKDNKLKEYLKKNFPDQFNRFILNKRLKLFNEKNELKNG